MPGDVERSANVIREFRKTIFFKRYKYFGILFLISETVNIILAVNLWKNGHEKVSVWLFPPSCCRSKQNLKP